jgi:hypothetical protein
LLGRILFLRSSGAIGVIDSGQHGSIHADEVRQSASKNLLQKKVRHFARTLSLLKQALKKKLGNAAIATNGIVMQNNPVDGIRRDPAAIAALCCHHQTFVFQLQMLIKCITK